MHAICISINPRLLTWEKPEWKQAGRRRFTAADPTVIVSPHSNM